MPLVKINYKRIHYRDAPPTNGGEPRETFILSHGLGSSQNYFTAVTPALCEQGYRCITFDMTGSGRSPYSGIEQSVHSLATDIIDLMDALSIPKAVIVGHSMSGMTAPECAVHWPDRVSAIALFGPVFPTKEGAAVFEQRVEAVEQKGIDAMAEVVPFTAPGKGAKPIVNAIIRELVMGTEAAAYISLCRVIASAYLSPPDYPKIKCPVLIVAGEEDKSTPVAGCQKIYDALGTSKKSMVIQKGIGHWMCVEDPDDCAAQIIKFFKQIQ